MADLASTREGSVDTVFALPPPLRTVVLELLADRGLSYLRYRHLRHALSLAGPCESVLILAAARGLAGIALALEHPATSFTLSELPTRKDRLDGARRLVDAFGLENVRFATIDPTSGRRGDEAYDLVASFDLLQTFADPIEIADAHLRFSRRLVFALVPFAPAANARPALERASAARGRGDSSDGFDAFELFALFPDALAVRGCYWVDAGAKLRSRLEGASVESIDDELDPLLALGEADVRPGFPRAKHDARGVWVLADGGLARGESKAWSDLARRGGVGTSRSTVRVERSIEPGVLLAASGMLDPEYYRERYPDIAAKGVDPLDHYLRRGAAEGRWPNASFDSKAYAREAGIDLKTVNPAVHHLTHGAVPYVRYAPPAPRVRAASASERVETPTVAARATAPIETMAPPDVRGCSITIVMPIFDGGDHVRRAIEAVLAETRLPDVELLLVDDASTDPDLVRDLERYARLDGVTVVRNATNLGFTKSVNRGFEHALAGSRDVVVLNSDTRVGPGFLEALVLAAYAAPDVATATALSDSAGAFSTPAPGANDTLCRVPLERVTRLSRLAASTPVWEVPTGNGFCMYVRADALAAVGLFDDARFPRGYGEENDFCMRAAAYGLRHVVALGAYVHHVNAVSFGVEKAARVRESRAVLDALHPDYTSRIRAAFDVPSPLTRQRDTLARSLETTSQAVDRDPARPRALYVISTKTGGTPQTNQDLMRGVSHLYHPLLLSCDARTLTLVDASTTPHSSLATHRLRDPIGMLPHTSDEYDRVVASWMERFHVELLHVRHMAWHGLGLTRVARRLGIPVIVSLHDFYSVCPSVNLTDGRAPWAPTGYANPTIVAPLWEQKDPASFRRAAAMPPRAFLTLWQRRMNTMLEAADRYVTTSRTAKEVLSGSLPVLRERAHAFRVIPHGRDFAEMTFAAAPPTPDAPLRVLLPGNITESKGLATILRMLELDRDGTLELHSLGNARASLQNHPRVKHHGTYDREEFIPLVRSIRPHVSLIASIWPETFCHTLTESWAAGIPVIGSSLGAVGERIASEGGGFIVDPHDAEGILALCQRLRHDASEWHDAMRAVEAWQRGLGERETVAAMTKQYLALYRELLRSRRRFGARNERGALGLGKRVGLVANGPMASVVPALSAAEVGRLGFVEPFDVTWIDAASVARTGACEFDAVIVRAGAATPVELDAVADACADESVPLHLMPSD